MDDYTHAQPPSMGLGVCRDCGTTEDMFWWEGKRGYYRAGSHGKTYLVSSAVTRCRLCYNAYTMANYYRRTGKSPRVVRGPAPHVPAPLVSCGSCGAPFKRSNQSMTCSSCASSRRNSSEQRRRERMKCGDRDIHWLALGERDGWRCHICAKKVPRVGGDAARMDGATVDHLVPIADGGKHAWDNVALAHRSCNLSRGARGEVQLRLVG
jgi:5-methylcytosine-specific restriction endonuclease McrA